MIESPVLSLVHGIGKKDKFNYDSIRYFVSNSLRIARTNRIKEAIFIIPELSEEYYLKNGLFYMSSAVVEGALLGLYEFKKYKTKDDDKNNNKAGILILSGFISIRLKSIRTKKKILRKA
jgi:Cytosol aminopeptidase family, N-terminal domain.